MLKMKNDSFALLINLFHVCTGGSKNSGRKTDNRGEGLNLSYLA